MTEADLTTTERETLAALTAAGEVEPTPEGDTSAKVQAAPKKPGPRTRARHTPTTRAALRGTIEFLQWKKIPFFKSDVFEFYGVTRTVGFRLLRENKEYVDERKQNDPNFRETRGRKPKISPEQRESIRWVIEAAQREGRFVSWKDLATETGLGSVHQRTIKRACHEMGLSVSEILRIKCLCPLPNGKPSRPYIALS